jgi:hypothetical protein
MYPMHLIKHVKLLYSCLSQLKYRAKHTYYLAAHCCTIHFPQPGAVHFWPQQFGSKLTKSVGNGLAMPTLPLRSAFGFALLMEGRHCLVEIHFELLVAIGPQSAHPFCHGLLHFNVPTDPKQYSTAF